jgi:cephalosporin hydroxylase
MGLAVDSIQLSEPRSAVADFHRLYYESSASTWLDTTWLGCLAQKCPLDLWMYQELVCSTRPDVIIETGTYDGGSALFLASVLDLLGGGSVVTIDIEERAGRPAHPRVEYVLGSSVRGDVAAGVLSAIPANARVMVILDSDHSRDHVLTELELYADRVTVGCYLVVEDTNVNGHPVLSSFGPGPAEALADFLLSRAEFEVDKRCEKFFMTFNPGGYLRRVR